MSYRSKHRAPRKIDLAAIEHKAAFSKKEFCARNGICVATLNNYMRDGCGPVTTRVGGRVLITREAEAEWHARLQKQPMPTRGRPRAQATEAKVASP